MPSILSGRLLKSDTVPQRATAVSLVYSDIDARCDDLLQQAREQAQQIIDQAQQQAQQIHHDAQLLGHATGSLEAEAEFEAAVEAEVQRRLSEQLQYCIPPLQSATTQLLTEREQLLLQWESALVRLSLRLAERIVRRELEINPAAPRALIAEVLQLTAGASSIALRMNPADIAQIEAHPSDWHQLLSSPNAVKVIPDHTITRGGCLVETDAGDIDATIETQLNRIAEELLPAR